MGAHLGQCALLFGRVPQTQGSAMRHLILILGDQLDAHAAAFDGFDPAQDAVWMAEVAEEATHVPSAKQRIVLFLSAMRHFAAGLRERGIDVRYTAMDAPDNRATLARELRAAIAQMQPVGLVLTAPGDWRVLHSLRGVAHDAGLTLDIRDDRHFFSTVRDFAAHTGGRKQIRLEYWYRELRRRTGVLMHNGEPVGGAWNFDAENRGSFGHAGPGAVPAPPNFPPDAITSAVIDLVNDRFAAHPGTLDSFNWPVTRPQALQALGAFVTQRLPLFGQYQDAIWQGEPFLYHALLASSLNLKLLSAREVVEAAEAAYHAGRAPLAAVEGFIRQILGWREYVRGIYWTQMPGYLERNAMQAHAALPDFYWTGDTPMACLSETIRQTLRLGYAHHIQRLMVTGLYALLLGVHPRAMHEWYLAVYVDAVEWVELPNTLGMSQYADAGMMASKPYVASGKYIQRMSNYCTTCPFDPAQATGAGACPFTTLYWDYLARHETALRGNQRMAMQVRNLARLAAPQLAAIRTQAAALRTLRAGTGNPA